MSTAVASARVCVAGCLRSRRHVTACEDRDTCLGCLPRSAEYGQLCYPCHRRLADTLGQASGQVLMLAAAAGRKPASNGLAGETTARITSGWRTSAYEAPGGPYARHAALSGKSSEPIRLNCLALADEMRQFLSNLVGRLCADYAMRGPDKLQTMHERAMAISPDPLYAVPAAAAFLTANLERLEWYDTIGTDLARLTDLMSRCHAVLPWREEIARLDGIACPECHARALVRRSGDQDVTCLKCNANIPPTRYGIWIRMLADEARGGG